MIKVIIQPSIYFFRNPFLSLSIDYEKNTKCYQYSNRNAGGKIRDNFIKEKMC